MKPNIKKARKHFNRLRELAEQGNSPLKGMTEEQIIEQMRRTREEVWNETIKKLWNKKVASRP